MVYPRTATEFWYWCEVSERWQECSEEDYHMKHYGNSFTKSAEANVNYDAFSARPHQQGAQQE